MNSDKSQTPKPAIEPLDELEEQSFTAKSRVNSDVEPVEAQPTIEPMVAFESMADLEATKPADKAVTDDDVKLLTEIEEQISALEELGENEEKNQAEFVVAQRVAELQRQEQALRQEIATLEASYQVLSGQIADTQATMGRIVQEALAHLEQRKQSLQIAVEQLERRQERIRAEMRTTFAGTSQDLAIRVQGFKDYLTGSLQDLAAAAEQLELVPKANEEPQIEVKQPESVEAPPPTPQFTEQRFQSVNKQVRRIIDQYRNQPDYYGPPWQLRRTFEPVHAERVSHWFFTQGGRGALRTMGSRLQNILISSATISVLYALYGDLLRTLVLANTPERLGDWRRGLQDCLGISRSDFGPDRGVVLFETAEAVALKAERLIKENQMPLIIIDDTEDKISLALLQFPLLLAFAPDPATVRDYDF